MITRSRALGVAVVCAAGVAAAACGSPQLRVSRSAVDEGKTASVIAYVSGAAAGATVAFKIADGQECGTVSPASAAITDGRATATFTGAMGVEDCKATIEASVGATTSRTSLDVNKVPLTRTRIDGVSVLALFAIASFAVDRMVRAVLFVLSFSPRWRRIVPEGGDRASAKKQRLAYVVMASVLAVVVLGWFGRIRMLAALGFAQTDPVLDTLFTGLLLVGGADRIEALLGKMGAGVEGADTAAAAVRPIEITGRLVLEDTQKKEPSSLGAGNYSIGV